MIAKIFLDLAGGIVVFIFRQDVATDCIKSNTNITPFEVTRQDMISHWAKIPKDTTAGQPGWSTEVTEAKLAIANYVPTIRGTSTSWIQICYQNWIPPPPKSPINHKSHRTVCPEAFCFRVILPSVCPSGKVSGDFTKTLNMPCWRISTTFMIY